VSHIVPQKHTPCPPLGLLAGGHPTSVWRFGHAKVCICSCKCSVFLVHYYAIFGFQMAKVKRAHPQFSMMLCEISISANQQMFFHYFIICHVYLYNTYDRFNVSFIVWSTNLYLLKLNMNG